MARAKRHYIPYQIWHITQRCHKREFLLKFKQDRYRWIQWLFEAKRRFGLVVLNYVATSNHTHLILKDDSEHRMIPQAIGLIAGRTAQEYNRGESGTESRGCVCAFLLNPNLSTIKTEFFSF